MRKNKNTRLDVWYADRLQKLLVCRAGNNCFWQTKQYDSIFWMELRYWIKTIDYLLPLLGDFIPFIPTMLTSIIFVISSKFYRKELTKTIKQYRTNLRRRFNWLSWRKYKLCLSASKTYNKIYTVFAFVRSISIKL